jgi:L-asparaginase
LNVTRLPSEVRQKGSRIATVPVAIKGPDGKLLDAAIPKVVITKDANYWDDDSTSDLEAEVDLIALIGHMPKSAPLAGFVVEGLTPCGRNVSNARHRLMLRAVYSGLPVVCVGRGNTEGLCSVARSLLYRRLESDRDEGSAIADRLLDEVRQLAASRGS